MPLDPNGTWIIDYRTACLIMEEETAERCAAVEGLCQNNFIRIVHSEREKFKAVPELCSCYVDTGCPIPLGQEIIDQSKLIQNHPSGNGHFLIDKSAVYIAAAAMWQGHQVITDAILDAGLSLPRICDNFGIQRANRHEFFACII